MRSTRQQKLAILGGEKSITKDGGDIFAWPIVTQEDEAAVLEVLRKRSMSNNDITKLFEKEFAEWIGQKYALAYPNGTESIRSAFWASGIGAGDEIICPSTTFWASCVSALTLGAAVNFADIDRRTLCIDPNDIEHRISSRTKAIVVVHYRGYPCDMDRIMRIAQKHNIKVIEDVSHAQGGYYKGKKLGTFGDVAAMSLMSGKSFGCGEAGIMVTDNLEIYERGMAFGFYERTGEKSNFCETDRELSNSGLKKFKGIPIGGFKHRLNQTATAMARVQLKYYDRRIAEIDKAMKRFWHYLEGVCGISPHMVEEPGSTMAGWFSPRGLYDKDALNGLPCSRFCEAVRAEGFNCLPGSNNPLHLHPEFHEADIYNMGKPTMIAFGQRDVRQGPGSLPVSENINEICFSIPWFKHDRPEIIEEYAAAFRKVAENAELLMKGIE